MIQTEKKKINRTLTYTYKYKNNFNNGNNMNNNLNTMSKVSSFHSFLPFKLIAFKKKTESMRKKNKLTSMCSK